MRSQKTTGTDSRGIPAMGRRAGGPVKRQAGTEAAARNGTMKKKKSLTNIRGHELTADVLLVVKKTQKVDGSNA